MSKNIELIGMVYKSVDYLRLISGQMKKVSVDDWGVGIRIIANDATSNILKELNSLEVPYTFYKDPNPNEYYLNRVYRCWNYAGVTSEYNNICFVNSDMVFSDGWLENLLKHHNGTNIPCSRLVESGKMLSGQYGISNNFGMDPNMINFEEWKSYSNKIKENKVMCGGLYMPCVFEKQRFVESGMYPEGNIYRNGTGTLKGRVVESGDSYFSIC